MDALTGAISNWWQQRGEYDFVDIVADDGAAVPTLWRSCLKLVQASSLAFQMAQAADNTRPQTGKSAHEPSSRPLAVEEEEEEEDGGVGEEEKGEADPSAVVGQESGQVEKSGDEVAQGDEEQQEQKEKKRREKDKKKQREKDKERVSSKHASSSRSHAPVAAGAGKDKRLKMLHTNDSAMRKAIHALRNRIFPPPSSDTALPAWKRHLATCPGCLANADTRTSALTSLGHAEHRDTPVPQEGGPAALEDSVEFPVPGFQEPGQGGEVGEAAAMASRSADGAAKAEVDGAPVDGSMQLNDDLQMQASGEDEAARPDALQSGDGDRDVKDANGVERTPHSAAAKGGLALEERGGEMIEPHTYRVEDLRVRMASWHGQAEDVYEQDVPTETCIHGHGKCSRCTF